MVIDKCENFRLEYNGKYEIYEFLPAIVKWYKLSGTGTKQDFILHYLYLIRKYYGGEKYKEVKERLRIKQMFNYLI